MVDVQVSVLCNMTCTLLCNVKIDSLVTYAVDKVSDLSFDFVVFVFAYFPILRYQYRVVLLVYELRYSCISGSFK